MNMKSMLVRVLVAVMVMSVVASTHLSMLEKRDIFKHLGNLKSGLIKHLSGKIKHHKKTSSAAAFKTTHERPNKSFAHTSLKTHSKSNPSPASGKSISISSHVFLTPNFHPANPKHTTYIITNQTDTTNKKMQSERTFKVKESPKKSFLISGPKTKGTNLSNKYKKKIVRQQDKSLIFNSEILTSEIIPVFIPTDKLKAEKGTLVEVNNDIEIFKESKNHDSHQKLRDEGHVGDSDVVEIRDELWREDLVGRTLGGKHRS